MIEREFEAPEGAEPVGNSHDHECERLFLGRHQAVFEAFQTGSKTPASGALDDGASAGYRFGKGGRDGYGLTVPQDTRLRTFTGLIACLPGVRKSSQ